MLAFTQAADNPIEGLGLDKAIGREGIAIGYDACKVDFVTHTRGLEVGLPAEEAAKVQLCSNIKVFDKIMVTFLCYIVQVGAAEEYTIFDRHAETGGPAAYVAHIVGACHANHAHLSHGAESAFVKQDNGAVGVDFFCLIIVYAMI